VREPAFFPAWTVKFMVALRSILERRGSGIRVLAPTDLSNRQPVQPFDAPLNVNLARAPLPGRAGPGIIDGHTAQLVAILEDISANAVGMGKLGARIGARGAIDPF